MTLPRRRVHRVLLGVLLATAPWGCGGTPPPQDPPAAPPDSRADALLVEARRLGDPDPLVRAAARERIDAMDRHERRRLEVLRAGLWLPDGPAAVACAARMPWDHLNEEEAARCVDLLLPELGDPDSEMDFDVLRSYLGSDDLHRVFALVPAQFEKFPDEDWSGILSQCHRMCRPEHLPALCELARHPSEKIRRGALDCLFTTLPHTDRHREELAALFLTWWPDEDGTAPPDDPSRPDGPGLPAALRGIIHCEFTGPAQGNSLVAHWAARWVADCRVVEDDLPTLRKMLDADRAAPCSRAAAWRALGDLRDAASRVLLESCARGGDITWESYFALHALARRGDDDARSTLRAHAAGNDMAWALHADLAPAEAAADLRRRIAAGDPGEEGGLAGFIADAVGTAEEFGIVVRREMFAGAAEAALATDLPGEDLLRIARGIPWAGTRALSREACRRMESAPPRNEDTNDPSPSLWADSWFVEDSVGYLDVAAPDAFDHLLRTWGSLEGEAFTEIRAWAAETRIRRRLSLPDEEPADSTVLRSLALDGDLPGEVDPDTARRHLEATLRRRIIDSPGSKDTGEVLELLAALQGVPAWPFRAMRSSFKGSGETETIFRRRVLRGEAPDMLHEWIEKDPDGLAYLAGAGRHPWVREMLEEARRRRIGPWPFVTGELAAAGDEQARLELWTGFRKGRYRLVDGAEAEHMVFHDQPERVRFWIDEMEGSCCRNYRGRWILDYSFDVESPDQSAPRVETRATTMRHWWDRAGCRFTWSDLAGRFVEGPVD